ncbi:GNAT family N-acetyltransferase [Radiobacillus kanasensis]|uniref:GNAT family N-acetyltransferase n=1 Tax=Radiobacillus kanasensis TaxID=2844358 RepID=UPI001E3A4F6C|nr:GNAT family N-acetyltransferase [Radiobacillus kanasensis]UFU00727.1 GNAT family N-acetyltransferase [Radiobacillus kanasensis]
MGRELIRRAKIEDIDTVFALFDACKEDLLQKEIFQWDDNYPSREYVEAGITYGEMYILERNSEIIGAVAINEWQAPEWENVNWRHNDGNTLIIHSLCVHPDEEGNGYGDQILRFVEEFARENGYIGVRLDAFSENERALHFYERRGYHKVDEVFFTSKPEGHETYYCFDKFLYNEF